LVRSDWLDKTEEKDASAPPQIIEDTTGDGIPDLTFSESPVWVVTDYNSALLGVASDADERAVIPPQCEACDSNESYHWVGDGYESGVFVVGDLVFPNAELTTPIKLLAAPADTSQALGELRPGIALHVLGDGPHYEAPHGPRRWHRVGGTINGRDLTGFVKAESLMDESGWDQYQEPKGARP